MSLALYPTHRNMTYYMKRIVTCGKFCYTKVTKCQQNFFALLLRERSTPAAYRAGRYSIEKTFAADRVPIENWYGPLKHLWDVMSPKYQWNEGNYDIIVRMSQSQTFMWQKVHWGLPIISGIINTVTACWKLVRINNKGSCDAAKVLLKEKEGSWFKFSWWISKKYMRRPKFKGFQTCVFW